MNNIHSSLKYVSGLLLLLVASLVNAQQYSFEQLDKDQDGMVAIKEAVADPVLLASFGKIDTDGDGKISKEELLSAELIKESKH